MEKPPQTSKAVRFAEAIRGVLFIIFALSLILAIALSQAGMIITTSDIINLLIGHWAVRRLLHSCGMRMVHISWNRG